MQHRVERLAVGGFGLIRTPDGVIFVPGVIPGELVEIHSTISRRGVRWAEKFSIVEPSPDRITPFCPYAGTCGGCDFQHLDYEAEKRFKREIVRDALRRGTGEELPLAEIKGANHPLEYRNSIRIQGGGGRLGYCRKGSNEIVEVDDCPIAAPAIRKAIIAEKQKKRTPKSLTIRLGSDGSLTTIATSHGHTEIEGGALTMQFCGIDFRVSPHSFFQVNIPVAELIAADMRTLLPESPRLLDLFAGVGTFATALADRYPAVIGFEIAKSAVADFRFNARRFPGVDVREWDAAKELKEPIRSDDVLILDPPRTGLPDQLREKLIETPPRMMAYVSCDVATFARDLKALLKGGYVLAHPINLYDMFPRTAHVELMAILKK